jgi:hypothetical protein
MKKIITLFIGLIAMSFTTQAASSHSEYHPINTYGKSYIFVEQGVEFSVFPDGQFDFVYVGGHNGSNVSINIGTPNVNISYNSGYNYDVYVQYDDYGAVIQVEDIPIYYDHYGRIIQAGSVEIRYNSRRIVRVGGLYVHYNPYGYFSHCTGYINFWNRHYIYRPWHVYYVRPYYTHCIVYDYPYREYYKPHRYSYHHHRKHYNRGRRNYANARRDFYRPGSRRHYKDGRVALNKDYKENRRNSGLASRSVDSKRGKRNDLSAKRMDKNRNESSLSKKRLNQRKNTNSVSKKRISSNDSYQGGKGISKRENTISKRGKASRKNSINSSSNKRSVSKKSTSGISANKGRPVNKVKKGNTVNNKRSYAKRGGTTSKRTNTKGISSRSKGSASRRGL